MICQEFKKLSNFKKRMREMNLEKVKIVIKGKKRKEIKAVSEK